VACGALVVIVDKCEFGSMSSNMHRNLFKGGNDFCTEGDDASNLLVALFYFYFFF
jgi:hypothetical protein